MANMVDRLVGRPVGFTMGKDVLPGGRNEVSHLGDLTVNVLAPADRLLANFSESRGSKHCISSDH